MAAADNSKMTSKNAGKRHDIHDGLINGFAYDYLLGSYVKPTVWLESDTLEDACEMVEKFWDAYNETHGTKFDPKNQDENEAILIADWCWEALTQTKKEDIITKGCRYETVWDEDYMDFIVLVAKHGPVDGVAKWRAVVWK
jgi:hypothetical protein